MAGVSDKKEAIWLAAVIAFGNFIFTFVGIYLVDRAGRRKLLLGSLAGVIASLLLLGGSFYLAEVHDAYVTIPKPSHRQDICMSFNKCIQCTAKPTCGFCYAENSSQNIFNASCVLANTHRNRAVYGPCSTQKVNTGRYRWAHEACPYKNAWIAVVALSLYIATFAPGMGPMPWTINSEIHPLWARSTSNACATATNWIFNLFVSLTFLSMTEWLTRPGAFWFYAAVSTVGWVFLYFKVPETKGKKLEEIEVLFQ